MSPLMHVASESWQVSALWTLTLGFTALAYLRGWRRLRSTSWNVIRVWQLGSCLFGLFLIWVAAASPVAALDAHWLTGHMAKHLLLMTIAPPLVLLGAPLLSLSHGLPQPFMDAVIRPLLQCPPMRRLGRALGHLAVCWLAATIAIMGWHIPEAFALGMRSGTWHAVEQTSFLGTGFLFWWPVVRPWPSASPWPRWSLVLYLFLATMPCDVLSAFLVFSERVAYPVYLSGSRHDEAAVLGDQQTAGALMWTCVTIVYLVAGTILTTRLLSAPSVHDALAQSESAQHVDLREDLPCVERV
jgi:putative membrane protein